MMLTVAKLLNAVFAPPPPHPEQLATVRAPAVVT